jgi:alginate biosynthesis protein Alg44
MQTSAPISAATPSPSGPNAVGQPLTGNVHPVIRMPFSVLIDGRQYEGMGLSLVGAVAQGLAAPHMEGEKRLATLVFPLSGYNVTVPVDVAIDRVQPESGALDLSFVDPSGPHLPQLRHIVNAYLAGRLVALDGVLAAQPAVASANAGRSTGKMSASRFAGGLLRGVALTALTAGLLLFVGGKLYERFFVIEVQSLSIAGEQGTELRSLVSGQIEFVDPKAGQGEVAFAVRSVSGQLVNVAMPCNCKVAPDHLRVGDTVLAGEPVLSVAPVDAPILIKTAVTVPALQALASGGEARVTLPDGTVVKAGLQRSSYAAQQSPAADDKVDVVLVPDVPIVPEYAGLPLSVEIDKNPGGALGSLQQFFNPLASNLKGLVR